MNTIDVFSRRAGKGIFFLLLFWQTALSQHREIDSLESTLRGKDDISEALTRLRLSELYDPIDFKKSVELAIHANEIGRHINDPRIEYATLSRLYKLASGDAERLNIARQIIQVAAQLGDESLLAAGSATLGEAFLLADYASKATEKYIEAYKTYKALHDPSGIGNCLIGLGLACALTGDKEQAAKYLSQALKLSEDINDRVLTAKVLLHVGKMATQADRHEEALAYFSKAMKLSEQLNGQGYGFSANLLASTADVYAAMNNPEKAIDYYKKALYEFSVDAVNGRPVHEGKVSCQTGLGKAMTKMGDRAGAILVFNDAIKDIDKTNYSALALAYGGLASAYENSSDYRSAFVYRTSELLAKDSLNARLQMEKVNQLRSHFQLEANEQMIVQLKDEKSTINLFTGLLSALLILVAILVIYFISRLRTTLRKVNETAQNERQRYDTVTSSQQQAQKELKEELECKTNELTTFTLRLIQKNEILDAVRKEADEIKRISSDEIRNRINRLITSINLSQSNDRDWDSFKLYFDQSNKGFFENLTASYPSLNGKDLKLCALLRLNLDTKQIATILDISPDSAKVARHRVRKKIGLRGDNNLAQFLNALPNR